jgi:hypothetical protein
MDLFQWDSRRTTGQDILLDALSVSRSTPQTRLKARRVDEVLRSVLDKPDSVIDRRSRTMITNYRLALWTAMAEEHSWDTRVLPLVEGSLRAGMTRLSKDCPSVNDEAQAVLSILDGSCDSESG